MLQAVQRCNRRDPPRLRPTSIVQTDDGEGANKMLFSEASQVLTHNELCAQHVATLRPEESFLATLAVPGRGYVARVFFTACRAGGSGAKPNYSLTRTC